MRNNARKRIASIVLSAIMLFISYIALPVKALAEAAEEAELTDAVEAYADSNDFSQDNTLPYSPLVGEIGEERDESVKVFRRADGAQEAIVYSDPIHYLKDDTWETIDNTLELVTLKDGTQAYRNQANDFIVSFSPYFSTDNLITVESKGHILSWRFTEDVLFAQEEPEAEDEPVYETLRITDAEAEVVIREHKEPETDEERDMLLRYPEELTSELTYKDPETGLNVHYVLSGKRLSEQIVLDHAPEHAAAFSTLLTTNGLKAEEKDGRIVFVDESDEAIFEIMPPVMYDANGEESAEIEVRLIETEDGYAYTLIPDMEWLQDETRMYPVVLDPDIRTLFSANVDDTYVRSSTPNQNYNGRDCIYVSPNVSDTCYSLIRIASLPNLKSGDIILNASIHLTRYYGEGNYYNTLLTGYRITGTWNVGSVTYSNLPAYESTASTFAIAPCTNYVSDLDITSLTKDWYETPGDNYGILLKSDEYAIFRSSEYNAQYSLHPSFSIIYRNSTGLEGNWTYYSQSAGRAGTGSVNLASGNLTWVLSDGGITNGALPISLSHVYNVNDIGSDFGYGRGWRLNYAQTLKRFPVANGNSTTLYFEYTDGDGTRHYYKEQGSEFVNELDKESVLTFDDSNATATITDKGDNKLVFQTFTSGSGNDLQKNGRLIRVEDANGNQTLITYSNPNGWSLRISKIQEQLSGFSAGQELVLGYEDGKLKTVTAPNGLNSTFEYTVNDDLASASYTDGKSVTFNYSDHRLAKATNIDGYNLRYIYNSKNGVRKVTEYAGNTEGQYLLFGYGRNKTVVTDRQNHKTVYMTDSLGQPISVTDPEGRAMYAAYNTAPQTQTQISAVSKLQYSVVNLLKNHGFEQSSSLSDWTAGGTGISADSSVRKDGLRSAKFIDSASQLALSQTVSVVPGQTYTLSAYFKGSGQGQVKAVTGSNTFTGDLITANTDDWTRATVTFKATSGTATVSIVVPANSGEMHADSVQLELAPTPNRYNMLENSDFENGTNAYVLNYSDVNGVISLSAQGNHPDSLGSHVFRLKTQMKGEAYIAQTIPVAGSAGDTYSFGAWMQSNCPPESEQWYNYGDMTTPSIQRAQIGVKRLKVEFLDDFDAVVSSSEISFAVDTKEWQFASGAAVASGSYSKIRIKAMTKRCIGETLVDGIQLYRETFSQGYSYDSEGNLTGYTSLIGQQNSFAYDDDTNDLTASTDPRGNTTTYTYDSHHNVKTVTTAEGVKASYDYNARGQVYHTRIGSSTVHIDTYTERGNDGALLSKTIDARGKEVKYTNQAGTRLNTQIEAPKGNKTSYVYGNAAAMLRLASMTSDGLGTVKYTYDQYGKLTEIKLVSFENNTEIEHNKYQLTYDAWSRPLSTKVGANTLSTNTYDEYGRLWTVTYANGLSARYVYDDLDRVRGIYQTENNTESFVYSFIYNGDGDLYELRNYRTNRASFFEYDHAGRCMASTERAFTVSGGVISYGATLSSYQYRYDACSNLTKLTCSVAGTTWSTTYTYDGDNRPKTATLSGGTVITNTYDTLGRLTKRTIGLSTPYETRFEYWLNGSNRTTLLHKYYNGSDDPFVYSYDDNGNITAITQGSTSTTYVYDTADRLIRENNGVTNQTVTYEYDAFGNILNKTTYAYTTGTLGTPTGTVTYTYGNSAWGDQLTNYNGQTITYDSMGNPLSYRGYTFAWRGKQLTGAASATQTISFEYNEDGLRQRKTVNNTSTDYYYNGTVLIGMQRNGTKYLFSYDASGSVVSVKYNGSEYYYVRNGQGDIIRLIDATGATVVEYTYNTWGKAVTTTGSLAGTLGLIQPFRYRGYVYDWETGLYYLQSRYYDPTVGRFISADVLLSTGQGVMGHNCYAYCLGNPVNMCDTLGSRPDFCVSKPDGRSSNDDQYIYYDVPISDQENESICWAFCQAMTEAFDNYEKLSVEEVNNRAIEIAQRVFGSKDEKKWNRANFPHNKKFWPVYEKYIVSISVLYKMLKVHGPMYAYYKKGNEAHYVVVTGVNIPNNIVYTNNPWGYKGEQTFEEFLNGFYTGDGSDSGYYLEKIYYVKWKNRGFE